MQEEQDTCRICSAPAEPDQPLFHPCKCSGTIRYIHQDCLTTWLAHSKKHTCDVCKHSYSFTKVYAPDMPRSLPPTLVVRRLVQQVISIIIFIIRAVVVACIWLALLPWITVWTWRALFAMGDSIAFWIGDLPNPSTGPYRPIQRYNFTSHNLTSTSSNTTLVTMISSHPAWKALSADIFLGQIIASLIVLTFVAVFLLREWVSQNARPGVFEGVDAPLRAQDPPGLPNQIPPQVDGDQRPEPQIQPLLPEQVPPANVPVPGPVFDPEPRRRFPDHRPLMQRRNIAARRRNPLEPRRRGGDKGKDVDRGDDGADVDAHTPVRRRLKVKQTSESEEETNGPSYRNWNRALRVVQEEARIRRTDRHPPLPIHPDEAKFTFTAKLPPRTTENVDISSFGQDLPRQSPFLSSASSSWTSIGQSSDKGDASSSPSRSVPSPPPVFSSSNGDPSPGPDSPLSFPSSSTLSRRQTQDDSESSVINTSPQTSKPSSPLVFTFEAPDVARQTTLFPSNPSNPLPYPLVPRRPPMPSATVSPIEDAASSSPGAGSSSGGLKGLVASEPASPSLATYSAPEELESGGSTKKSSEYFDQPVVDDAEEDLHAEFPFFFENDDADVQPSENDGYAGQEPYSESEEDDDIQELNRDEDEDHDDDRGGDDLRVGNGHADPQQDPAQAPDPNDDMEANLDDDMEGAMEAIGLRGPILTVLQNAALMIFVLDITIGLGIWVPYTVGKSTALLTLHPRRLLQLIHLPIKAIRLVTDPLVDSILLFLGTFVFSPILRSIQYLTIRGFVGILHVTSLVFGRDVSSKLSEGLLTHYTHTRDLAIHMQIKAGDLFSPDKIEGQTSSSSLTDLISFDNPIGRIVEPYFEALGREVRTTGGAFQASWIRLTLGHGPVERTFAISLGYAMVAFGLAIYMNVLTAGTVKHAGKAVRTAIRQQLLVVKVAAFIIIELIIFPLGCGINLNSCTIWFFPEANFRARLVFVRYAPLTATFYHWVIGTMFMYLFAILLGGCRRIMRPGAMWFIKDPQNQNMHPIRDILDRPTLTHLYKLFQSAIMYSLVVVCGVGSVAGLIHCFAPPLLPFRWKPREPLSSVAYDLVFLHLVLPYTIHYFRPRKAAREIGIILWKWLSSQLRLSSYMFGGRYPAEEMHSKKFILGRLLRRTETKGSWRRVPANDNVAIFRSMRATAEVDDKGKPLNEREQAAINAQNGEAERNRRNPEDDYTVVYIPPHFRLRIALFIFTIWIVCCVGIAGLIAMPTLLGRRFFVLFTHREVHDGYSFIVGFHLLWACWLIGRAVDRMDRRRQRKEGGPRAWWPLFLAKRTLLWLAKAFYMAFFLVVVVPTLIALVVEVYLIFPIRSIYDPTLAIHIRLVDMWVLGLFYTKIILRLPGFEAPHKMNQGIQNINRNGWTRPDPIMATKEVIAPTIAGLLGMLLLPPALLWICARTSLITVTDRTLFLHVYPAIFAGAGMGRAVWGLHTVYMRWSQSVRDKEFLVEMRLKNLESEGKEKEKERARDVSGVAQQWGDDKSEVDSDDER